MARGKRYSKEEDAIIRKHVGTITAESIGALIGRPTKSIQYRISKLGLDGRVRGVGHPQSKLDTLRAAMVITLNDAGFTPMEIHTVMSRPCPVNVGAIQAVCNGESWGHALEDYSHAKDKLARSEHAAD